MKPFYVEEFVYAHEKNAELVKKYIQGVFETMDGKIDRFSERIKQFTGINLEAPSCSENSGIEVFILSAHSSRLTVTAKNPVGWLTFELSKSSALFSGVTLRGAFEFISHQDQSTFEINKVHCDWLFDEEIPAYPSAEFLSKAFMNVLFDPMMERQIEQAEKQRFRSAQTSPEID